MPKPLRFAGDARREISEMPLPVKTKFGYDLRDVQNGDTYRCVYAAKFPKAVYVLSVFQKKSHSGIATPQRDIDAVFTRCAQAQADYEAEFGE